MNLDIIDKLVKAMEREELDAIVLLSPENFAYATGFIVPSNRSCGGGTPRLL